MGAGAARKVFDLKLTELGPYNLAFTRNGRHMLLGGRKGHLAVMDWQSMRTVCELQVCARAAMPEPELCFAVLRAALGAIFRV